MKQRLIVFLCLALSLCHLAAQEQTAEADTAAYRQYFTEKYVGNYVSLSTLSTLFRHLQLWPRPNASNANSWAFIPCDVDLVNFTYSTHPAYPSKFIEHDNYEIGRAGGSAFSPFDPYAIYDNALKKMYEGAKAYIASCKDKNAEKQRLVRALTAFDSVSTHKPIFYADIYGRFKGSAAKYVDYLFKKSFLFRKSHLEKFVRYPKAKTLQRDLGVQFVIGLALYESWIRDVREGRVTENTLPQQ